MKRFNKNQNNKGIVILFAVVIAAIVLAITLGITSIAFKSIQLSTSARDSHFAYFSIANEGLYLVNRYAEQPGCKYLAEVDENASVSLNIKTTTIHGFHPNLRRNRQLV